MISSVHRNMEVNSHPPSLETEVLLRCSHEAVTGPYTYPAYVPLTCLDCVASFL